MQSLSNINQYPCPNCDEDVDVPVPASKYVQCQHCKVKLEVHPDSEFYDGLWHDLTTLSIVDPDREHMKRMVRFIKDNERTAARQIKGVTHIRVGVLARGKRLNDRGSAGQTLCGAALGSHDWLNTEARKATDEDKITFNVCLDCLHQFDRDNERTFDAEDAEEWQRRSDES